MNQPFLCKNALVIIFGLVLFISGFFLSSNTYALCQTPPSSQEMDKQFYASLEALLKNQKTRIAIFPFQDGSLVSKDPTLQQVFAVALYELLATKNKIAVYHPFVTMNSVFVQSLSNDDFFSDAKIKEGATQIGATHAVYGMFQKQPQNQLRYFIKIMNIEKNQTNGAPLEYVTEEGDRFFTVLADATKDILKIVHGKKINSKEMSVWLQHSPGFESFRFFTKGMLSSRSYKETDLAIAKVWFEKAYTINYSYTRALEEKSRTLFMMGLIHKQMGKDFALLIDEARQSLNQSDTTESKKNTSILLLPTRWSEAQEAFVSGVTLLESGLGQEAQKAFLRTTHLVPEDGLAHHYLSKTGIADSSAESSLANQLNSCL